MTNGHFFLAQQTKVKMCGFYGLKKSAVGDGLWAQGKKGNCVVPLFPILHIKWLVL